MLRRLLLMLLLTSPALADYPAGVRAWGRGDFAAAAREFLPQAQAGDAESQYMMGRLYSLGEGVPRDWVQAWAWFDRAAGQGHAEARLAREGLDHVLNPAELAAARTLGAPPPPPPPQPPPAPPVALAEPPPGGRAVVLVPRRGVVAEPQQAQAER